MTALSTADLSPLEHTYLGVLALGLVAADQARDPRFRMEYVCARCHALALGQPVETFLAPTAADEYRASADFQRQLREALIDLDLKRVIGIGPPQDLLILKPSVERPDALYGAVDLNRHPPIFDRYLAQQCMDTLLNDAAAHRYLMALYADSGDVWHELYKQGIAQYR